MVKLSNSMNPEEMAHDEAPHLGLYCLPSSLYFSIWYNLGEQFFKLFRRKFCHLLFGALRIKVMHALRVK